MVVKAINSFEEFQAAINSGRPVLIDFWATWCGPCKAISPILEKFSNLAENEGIDFYKVDVDEQDRVAQEVGVRAMPTFIVFKNGNKISDLIGANPGKLQELVKTALAA